MPHECTNCGRTFPDGSKEMLSGCPDCGGNKFQFAPAARAATGSSESAATQTSDSAGSSGGNAAGTADDAGTVERAAETVRDWVSSGTSRSGKASATDADEPGANDVDSMTASSDPASAAAAAGSTPTDGTRRDRSTDDRAERSWPSSDESADGAETPAGEFEEWPETARRPEDRSPPEADASSKSASTSETDASSASASTSTSTVDASSAASSATSAAEPADSPGESIMADSENDAQADARSEVVSTNDLPDNPPQHDQGPDTAANADDKTPPSDGRVVSEPSGEQPSIEELREELNEQFESIKIVSPGQYELNLMELYNREEYIISLQEDGRYVIDVPDSWRDGEE
ncbi:Protein of unknown function DUF2072, Zinc- ribbon [Haloterrigena turkmenica DSM 5511]|uniref:Origin-associated protein OapC n=1 Tax=Haloterrigena turkmenica (strain ATCC 51198 / DSM 5511 / JCM 9101 / NCIMB 13204 / VKM B-1734 / 4k) TaxID=543526 RepID=D2RSE9_HALTV|nr:Zn-ribbon containing protein [Haloterrigena turkmenica]ADB62638.1 Protein of unknown function DUF2072, Zinc- ribbon [Haloterrigena turkmenica DSM 5511]